MTMNLSKNLAIPSWTSTFLLEILVMVIVAVFGSTSLKAQSYSQTDIKFANKFTYEAQPGERVLKTWYHYVVSRQGLKYVVRTFFPETGALTGYWTYQDRNLTILDGPFAMYSDDGVAITKGSYRNSRMQGPWSTSSAGQELVVGAYDTGLRIGEWKEFYLNGKEKSVFTFDAGEELGPYVMYDTLGVVIDKGNSILGERYTDLPPSEFESRIGRAIVDEFPCFGTCDPSLSISERAKVSGLEVSEYIKKNLQYPDAVRKFGIKGRVNASVLIDAEGNVADVQIVNGLCQPIADECKRLINEMPAWRPAIKGNKTTAVRVLVPFAFAPD